MAHHRLFRLANLAPTSSSRLNRVRVRVTFDLEEEGEGHATVSASLAEDGSVIEQIPGARAVVGTESFASERDRMDPGDMQDEHGARQCGR